MRFKAGRSRGFFKIGSSKNIIKHFFYHYVMVQSLFDDPSIFIDNHSIIICIIPHVIMRISVWDYTTIRIRENKKLFRGTN